MSAVNFSFISFSGEGFEIVLLKSLAIPQDPSHLLNILSQTGGVPAYTQMCNTNHHGTFREGLQKQVVFVHFLESKIK